MWVRFFLGFLMNVVGNGLSVRAAACKSGLTAVLIATTLFWSALVERLPPNGERFSKRALIGLSPLMGIVIPWPEMTNGGEAAPFVLGDRDSVGVVGCDSARRMKRHELGDNPFRSTALRDGVQRTMLLTAATINGDWEHLSFTPRTIAAMAHLSIADPLAYSAYITRFSICRSRQSHAYQSHHRGDVGRCCCRNRFQREAVSAALVLAGTWIVGGTQRRATRDARGEVG